MSFDTVAAAVGVVAVIAMSPLCVSGFSESEIPKIRIDLLQQKSLMKCAVRLLRNYNLPEGQLLPMTSGLFFCYYVLTGMYKLCLVCRSFVCQLCVFN